MKKIFTIAFIAVLLFTLNGCGGKKKDNADGTVTVKFWHSFISSTIPALDALIAKFEAENPGIKIDAQYIPSGDALIQKLVTSIRSKTAPDISWLHSDFLQDLVQADAIYKMDDFIKGKDGIPDADMNDIYPALLTFSKWKGTLYTLPMEATNLALLYNKDMFKKAGLDPNHPPATWDELYEYAKKLTIDKDGDGRTDQTGMFIPIFPAAGPLGSWMTWQWEPYIWQAGGDIITDDQTKVLYNSEAGVQALTLWQKIFRELNLRSFTNEFDNAFSSGKLAMAMDGPWSLPRYKDLFKGFNWAFAPLPAGPATKATVVGGEYLAIFKQSEHPDAAWKFIKWLTRPDVQAFWSMRSGYLPIRHAVKDVPEFKDYLAKNPNFKVFVDQMDYGHAQKPIDYGALEITRNMAEAIEKATIGNQDVRQALNEAAAKSNAILQRVVRK